MLRPARGIPRHFMEVIARMDVIESHGARIPILGFGTMTLKEDVCVQLVEASLKLGYQHLDTAQMYGNEREVGSGMRGSALKREDIFLTTKVWFTRLASGDFERSVDESLERLAPVLIGHAHGKTPAPVALGFLEQQQIIPIPRTSKRERLAENLGSLDLRLSEAEMAEIAELKRPDSRIVSPPQAPKWDT